MYKYTSVYIKQFIFNITYNIWRGNSSIKKK